MADKLKITLVKSPIGAIPKQRATVEALGLKKVNKTVEIDVYKRQLRLRLKKQLRECSRVLKLLKLTQ